MSDTKTGGAREVYAHIKEQLSQFPEDLRLQYAPEGPENCRVVDLNTDDGRSEFAIILDLAKKERTPLLWLKVIVGQAEAYVLLQHFPEATQIEDEATYAHSAPAELTELETTLEQYSYKVCNAGKEFVQAQMKKSSTATIFGYGFNFRDVAISLSLKGPVSVVVDNKDNRAPQVIERPGVDAGA